MAIKLKQSEVNKLLSKNKKSGIISQNSDSQLMKKKATKTSVSSKIKQIKANNSSLFCLNDTVEFCETNSSLTITLIGAKTISHNHILRQHYVTLDSYNKSWYSRIKNAVSKYQSVVEKWKLDVGDSYLLFEGIYCSKYLRDTDSTSGSLKPLIDGIVRANLVKDDSPDYLLIMPAFPIKTVDEKIILRLRPCPDLRKFFSHDFVEMFRKC